MPIWPLFEKPGSVSPQFSALGTEVPLGSRFPFYGLYVIISTLDEEKKYR
jgi:hypothetical protein